MKRGTISLPLHRLGTEQRMEHPGPGFTLTARATTCKQRPGRRIALGLNEELGKRRMRRIGLSRKEHHFQIAGQLDTTRTIRDIGQPQTASFQILAVIQTQIEPQRDPLILAFEPKTSILPAGAIDTRLDPRRLIPQRPERARIQIAHIEQATEIVRDRIGAPARERQPVPAQLAGA
jgi:hypothetical protein